MSKQTITWTVLPNGVTPALDLVRFSVHVAPRLLPEPAPGTLEGFPDWLDWPARVSPAAFQLEFPDILDQAGRPVRATATRVSKPESRRWTALFTRTSRVEGHAQTRFTRRRIRSYPTRHVRDFVNQRYGRFGARSPERFPTLDELAAPTRSAPWGSSSTATGPNPAWTASGGCATSWSACSAPTRRTRRSARCRSGPVTPPPPTGWG